MEKRQFEALVSEAFDVIPEKFKQQVKNVAFIVEDEPSPDVLKENGIAPGDTLFGLYTGIPLTGRGSDYGVGMVLPDTIHIYQHPIEESCNGDAACIKKEVFDTVWHEVAHYFGFDEDSVMRRELEGTNKPKER